MFPLNTFILFVLVGNKINLKLFVSCICRILNLGEYFQKVSKILLNPQTQTLNGSILKEIIVRTPDYSL